ncbi:LysR family transcriptional regulator [Achromobacter sp. Marseille-Q0513]|uniref:LysR family transcriptional regulator n=1 Tax=Achromobacter sp. Marseille-Q0513 TaxID=2829161 RepID=UPI001B952088|nr:LysR family transcriptional regulator [Achromobacter sp. Marseille-Q0513]MBR8651733.1 LysR family transcriptional regulator [Achromobacter sp. Marseille-Q0513]
MELRHLRCFVALAEELHFTRAAERLHIEQPPLSRAIKELEDDLGVVLFERNRRGTVLTEAGATFLQDVRRVFAVLKQAQENVRAVAAGLSGSLRIAVSDGAIDPRLSALLARCREEEPEIEIRLSEVPLADQLRGLRSGDFSIGFAHTAEVGDGIVTEPLWHDPLVVAVPARHPLLSHKAVPLHQLAIYPLVLCDPQVCEGYYRELARLLRPLERPPDVAEHVSSLDMMLTLVGAGYGVGFITETRIAASLRPDVVIRPLAMDSAVITTYLLRPAGEDSPVSVERFIARLRAHSDD